MMVAAVAAQQRRRADRASAHRLPSNAVSASSHRVQRRHHPPSDCGMRNSASTSGSPSARRRSPAAAPRAPRPSAPTPRSHRALQSRRRRGGCRQQVDLVQHLQCGLAADFQFRRAPPRPAPLLLQHRAGGVAHVQQQLGAFHLFQRRAKAGHERVRQVADEADRVRQQHLASRGQRELPQLGVERGEHALRRQHLRAWSAR